MKKNNLKRVVISLCLLLTVIGCNLGFSSKAFAETRLMSYYATGVRDGYVTSYWPNANGTFELKADGKVNVYNKIEKWSTSDRSRQHMVFEIWRRVGVGQYELYRTSQTIGGDGWYIETFNLRAGTYKIKIRSLDLKAYVDVNGYVNTP